MIHTIRLRFLIILFLLSVIGITKGTVFGSGKIHGKIPEIWQNAIMDTNIHTVLFQNETWEFSLPVVRLGTEDRLELQFDDFRDNRLNLGYTLIHCDVEWKSSDLLPQEYLSGFGKGLISDIQSSVNTAISYNHYRLVLTQEDCTPLISGNYALIVYDEENPDDIVLVRRLYVTENSITPEIQIKQPSYGFERETSHQIFFSFDYNTRDVSDPMNDFVAIAIQNNRPDHILICNKPYQAVSSRVEYTNPDNNTVEAGNEFRSIDLKSMKYQTENVAGIRQIYPAFHVTLKPDERRSTKPYFSKSDLNGAFYIDKEGSNDRHTEADYVYVHFRLSLPSVYAANTIYIAGAFTGWQYIPQYRMKYNESSGLFEATVLMKQGLYDYCYVTEDPESGKLNEYVVEGSYYETRNDYYVFIYRHDYQKRYDRLISFQPVK